jgi:PAS domain S-box-containing protein
MQIDDKPRGMRLLLERRDEGSDLMKTNRAHDIELATQSKNESLVQMTRSTLSQFLDISPDALIVINHVGTIVMLNKQTTMLFGFLLSELLGQPIEILLPERFHKAHRTHLRTFFSAPATRTMGMEFSFTGLRKDQTEFSVDISLRPLLVDGELHTIGTVYDVTRYALFAQAEQRARLVAAEQSSEIETIFNTLIDGIVVCNMQGYVLQCNTAACQILGIETHHGPFSHGTFLSLLSYAEFRDDYGQLLTPDRFPLQRILAGEVVTHSQAVELRKKDVHDHNEIWLSISGTPLRDHDGHLRGATCILRDMTEQRRLKRHIELLHSLIEIVEMLVQSSTHKDPQSVPEDLTMVTQAIGYAILKLVQRLLGCPYSILLGIYPQTDLLFIQAMAGFSPEQEQHLRPHLNRASLYDLINDPATLTLLKKQQLVPFDITQSPLLERLVVGSNAPNCLFVPIYIAHEFVGLLGVTFSHHAYQPDREEVTLITAISKLCALTLQYERHTLEQRRLIEDQSRVNEELERINTMQRTFLSVVGHEFRTALTSIEGFSALLRDKEYTDEKEAKDYANDIHIDAQRLERMITDLLDMEQMKQGQMQLRIGSLQVNEALTQVVKRLQRTTAHHTFDLCLDERQPRLEGDPDKLTQVFTNLLSNAVKYSPDGGAIVITSVIEGDSLHVSIQDHGVGIPAESIEAVFTPYHRVNSLSTRYISGTGLGLPIVKLIVELHQGQIWVESSYGQGSLFHMIFPLSAHQP